MKGRLLRRAVAIGSLVAVSAGCDHYDLSLVRPLSAPIRDGRPVVFSIDPLQYTVQPAEGHLVLQIYNPTDNAVRLDGRSSTVVDPAGQSHPLFDQTIAPRAYVKVIEPPLRPWYGRPVEFQVGGPPANPDELWFWDWPEQSGTVRLHLTFDGVAIFEHDVVVRRERVD